jgi:hypothetical protein
MAARKATKGLKKSKKISKTKTLNVPFSSHSPSYPRP